MIDKPIFSVYSDISLYEKLLEQYVSSLYLELDGLLGKLKEQDFQAIAKMCHRLAGTASTYGYPLLSQQLSAIECKVQEQDIDESDLQKCLQEVEQSIKSMKLALELKST